jgi:hypothetical protein
MRIALSAPRSVKQAAYRALANSLSARNVANPRRFEFTRLLRSGGVVLFQTTPLADVGCRKHMSGLEQPTEKQLKSSIYRE